MSGPESKETQAWRAAFAKQTKRGIAMVRLAALSIFIQFWVWALAGLSWRIALVWAASSVTVFALGLSASWEWSQEAVRQREERTRRRERQP